jgi:hypothetical protein
MDFIRMKFTRDEFYEMIYGRLKMLGNLKIRMNFPQIFEIFINWTTRFRCQPYFKVTA